MREHGYPGDLVGGFYCSWLPPSGPAPGISGGLCKDHILPVVDMIIVCSGILHAQLFREVPRFEKSFLRLRPGIEVQMGLPQAGLV